jgi:(4S)-4-hydroxy-5-phosphonooxypentane-2,3-dione isomerase
MPRPSGAFCMFVVLVDISVKPEHVAAFKIAAEKNHRGTRQESGNLRFDVLQLNNDATQFRLYEVYVDEAAFHAHQQTPHYFAWKATVEPFMATPRTAEKLTVLFPVAWA